MKQLIIILVLSFSLISCASIKERMPGMKDKIPVRKACTGNETGKTLSDVFCIKY